MDNLLDQTQKLWFDDWRSPPADGWLWAKTGQEARDLLNQHDIIEASLDHDMDYPRYSRDNGTALTNWMIQEGKVPPTITIHSWNSMAAKWMARKLEDAGAYVTIKMSKRGGPPSWAFTDLYGVDQRWQRYEQEEYEKEVYGSRRDEPWRLKWDEYDDALVARMEDAADEAEAESRTRLQEVMEDIPARPIEEISMSPARVTAAELTQKELREHLGDSHHLILHDTGVGRKGKYEFCKNPALGQRLYQATGDGWTDEEVTECDKCGGWHGRLGRFILNEDSDGFIFFEEYNTEAEAHEKFVVFHNPGEREWSTA